MVLGGMMVVLLGVVAGCVSMSPIGHRFVPDSWRNADLDPVPEAELANPPGRLFFAPSEPLTPEEELATFTVPEGFEVQLVASETDIEKPMQLAFDAQGALLVTTSTGYPLGPAPGAAPADKIYRLQINGETGRADQISVFASGLDIPSGIECLPGGRVIAASAPDILLLTDTDGDGVSDEREVLFTGFARDDTHEIPNSFTWGIDGWLYAFQGIVNVSKVKNKAGEITRIERGTTFRMQPDGTKVEVWAPGMTNPWGMAFDNHGDLFASDCESRPFWEIVRGFKYLTLFNDPDPLGWAPHITEDAHGASGFAGLAYYSAGAYPEKYRGSLFLGNPITNRIHRDRPVDQGSTSYLQRRSDFLVSTDPWFRPVDVELGPDGALYVADWYNGIIAHVEVRLDHPDRDKQRGRIWRIVYRGLPEEKADAPRAAEIAHQWEGPGARNWEEMPPAELLRALGETQVGHRRAAAAQLVHRFSEGLDSRLRSILRDRKATTLARIEALWLLERLGKLSVSDIAQAYGAEAPDLRRQAVRISGERRERDAEYEAGRTLVLEALDDKDPNVRREAVVSLRRTGLPEDIETLHARWINPPDTDTLLDYAFKTTLRDLMAQPGSLERLADLSPGLAADPRATALVAGITSLEAALELERRLLAGQISDAEQAAILRAIFRSGDHDLLTRAVARMQEAAVAGPPDQLRMYARLLLEIEPQASKHKVHLNPAARALAIRLAAEADDDCQLAALQLATREHRMFPELGEMAQKNLVRRNALPALRDRSAALLMRLDTNTPKTLLGLLADESEENTARMFFAMHAGIWADTPERLELALNALEKAPDNLRANFIRHALVRQPNSRLLLAQFESGRMNPRYLNDNILQLMVEHELRDKAVDKQILQLAARAPSADTSAQLMAREYQARFPEKPRDVRNGQIVFEMNCMPCHRIGGVGGERAPNLDGMNGRGIERLLHDILLPSQDIDPGYRTTVVARKSGMSSRGLLVGEGPEAITLLDIDLEEFQIPRDDIDKMEQIWMSPMPPNFGLTIPEADFLDMVGFLLNPPQRIERLTEDSAF